MYFDQNKNIDMLVFFFKCGCGHGRGVYSIVDIQTFSIFISVERFVN